jgi:hypothetical protein
MLGQKISSGGMGAVYRAFDEQNGEQIALKRLVNLRFANRFTIEARLLSQLRHPRVVRVIDHFADETGMYLVMQLVHGIDLARLLAERGSPGLPPAEAVAYAMQACQALQYVHAQQIVHRDVKPGNLILSGDGIVLVDFGIAREVSGQESGTVGVGTPRFMAPEVFGGGAVSPRSDVFGIAATLWTLITGEAPMYGRLTLPPTAMDVTLEVKNALYAGLEIIPERRIATVEGFAQALGAPLGRSEGVSLSLSVAQPAVSRPLLEAVVRTAAGVFDAASASIGLIERTTGELVYLAAWGAGAAEVVGVRLARREGIAGSVVASGQGEVVPDCKADDRFAVQIATGTGYVPNTMLVVPLKPSEEVIGVLSLLDRRDGGSYKAEDLVRAGLFADLALATLDLLPTESPRADTTIAQD